MSCFRAAARCSASKKRFLVAVMISWSNCSWFCSTSRYSFSALMPLIPLAYATSFFSLMFTSKLCTSTSSSATLATSCGILFNVESCARKLYSFLISCFVVSTLVTGWFIISASSSPVALIIINSIRSWSYHWTYFEKNSGSLVSTNSSIKVSEFMTRRKAIPGTFSEGYTLPLQPPGFSSQSQQCSGQQGSSEHNGHAAFIFSMSSSKAYALWVMRIRRSFYCLRVNLLPDTGAD